jgi:hypothetical protein
MQLNLSPETLFMLPLAVVIDLVGIILICFGLDDVGITDAIGAIFIGGWLLIRRGKLEVKVSKKDTKTLVRFGKTFIGELIPYLGALPFWTITVVGILGEPKEEQEIQQEEQYE